LCWEGIQILIAGDNITVSSCYDVIIYDNNALYMHYYILYMSNAI